MREELTELRLLVGEGLLTEEELEAFRLELMVAKQEAFRRHLRLADQRERKKRQRELETEAKLEEAKLEVDRYSYALKAALDHGADLLSRDDEAALQRGYLELVGLDRLVCSLFFSFLCSLC